jgi:phage shock protein PspC (stress-responsive transcriptional regulator)
MAPRLDPDLILFLVIVALFTLVVLGLLAYFRWAD